MPELPAMPEPALPSMGEPALPAAGAPELPAVAEPALPPVGAPLLPAPELVPADVDPPLGAPAEPLAAMEPATPTCPPAPLVPSPDGSSPEQATASARIQPSVRDSRGSVARGGAARSSRLFAS